MTGDVTMVRLSSTWASRCVSTGIVHCREVETVGGPVFVVCNACIAENDRRRKGGQR